MADGKGTGSTGRVSGQPLPPIPSTKEKPSGRHKGKQVTQTEGHIPSPPKGHKSGTSLRSRRYKIAEAVEPQVKNPTNKHLDQLKATQASSKLIAELKAPNSEAHTSIKAKVEQLKSELIANPSVPKKLAHEMVVERTYEKLPPEAEKIFENANILKGEAERYDDSLERLRGDLLHERTKNRVEIYLLSMTNDSECKNRIKARMDSFQGDVLVHMHAPSSKASDFSFYANECYEGIESFLKDEEAFKEEKENVRHMLDQLSPANQRQLQTLIQSYRLNNDE